MEMTGPTMRQKLHHGLSISLRMSTAIKQQNERGIRWEPHHSHGHWKTGSHEELPLTYPAG